MTRATTPLADALRASGTTNRTLAKALTLTDSYLCRVIQGRYAAPAALRERIAQYLGRPLDELWPPTIESKP